jgi:hypothetical protein
LIGWDESGVMLWSVDASFAVHNDYRSHTGATLTLGKGALISSSMKQKLNTKSSTEAELVGVDDSLNMVMWSKLFMEYQMKDHKEGERTKLLGKTTIIQQDNTSAIKMERFGKRSSTKRTRHLSIRYYYITSLLDEGMITAVTYEPTESMVADYLTKPLQGSLFRKHRNSILGITEAEEAEAHKIYQRRIRKNTQS